MNRRVLASFVIALVVIAGGVLLGRKYKSGDAAGAATQYKIAKVASGEVKKTVSSTGTLQAWKTVDIKARAGGELTTLAVDVGSEVTKGQLLAKIDPLDVSLSLNTAKADETSAKAKEAQSAKTYQLQIAQSAIAIRDAEASLKSAQASEEAARARLATARQQSKSQPELTRTAIANAQAAYNQAVQQRKTLTATNPQQRASAKAAYDQAVANRDNARAQVDRQKSLLTKGFVAQQAVDTAQANAEVSEAQVTSTKAKLDTIDAELSAGVDAANARVDQSRAALQGAQANSQDIVTRKNGVQESEAAYHQAQAQTSKARVAVDQSRAAQANNQIRQYDVQAATASIARAEASRINAQTTMDRTVIRSPMEGVVLQKYVEQGTIITSALGVSATGQSLVQLGDISRMYVDVTVDETDIANVDEGQTVDVVIEAYPGVPFEGKVTRVDPQAVVLQNVTSVHVRVEVDNSAPTFRLLKPGMNATCQFVIAKKNNVVNVPNEAVHEDDKGKYVEVAEGGKPAPADAEAGTPADPTLLIDVKKKHVIVEVGVEGNDNTEITSGLKDGDQIITQTIEPVVAAPASGSPFGGGGGGGRGFGGGGRGR